MLNKLTKNEVGNSASSYSHQHVSSIQNINKARYRKSALESVLRELNASSSDIEASACISSDGFNIAAVLDKETDADRYSAMCASLLTLATRAAQESQRGPLKLLLVEGESGVMLLVKAGQDAILAVAAKPGRNLGMIFMNARKFANKILVTLNNYPLS